jgi:hypothetical protein
MLGNSWVAALLAPLHRVNYLHNQVGLFYSAYVKGQNHNIKISNRFFENVAQLKYFGNRLMLFRETVAVYCKNHTEHTDTLCRQKTQSVPHRKHYVSATKPNRLMLLGKQSLFIVRTIWNTQIHSVGRKLSSYLTGNTLRLRYKAQPVNAV